jgi:hypothetical protein
VNRSPNLSKPALDDPELRPHGGSGLRRPWRFTRQRRYGRAKLHQDPSWASHASRRAPALVGSGDKSLSLSSFIRRRLSDLALQRFKKRRSEQLKVQRPTARRTLLRQPVHDILPEFHQVPREHVMKPFLSVPIARVYLIRGPGRRHVGLFSRHLPLRRSQR